VQTGKTLRPKPLCQVHLRRENTTMAGNTVARPSITNSFNRVCLAAEMRRQFSTAMQEKLHSELEQTGRHKPAWLSLSTQVHPRRTLSFNAKSSWLQVYWSRLTTMATCRLRRIRLITTTMARIINTLLKVARPIPNILQAIKRSRPRETHMTQSQ
jgi:hypothetical protein